MSKKKYIVVASEKQDQWFVSLNTRKKDIMRVFYSNGKAQKECDKLNGIEKEYK